MKPGKHYLAYCFSAFVLAGLLLAACTPGSTIGAGTPGAQTLDVSVPKDNNLGTETPTRSSPETNTPGRTPSQVSTETIPPAASLPAAVALAQQGLANTLNTTADQITVVSVERVEWPDACMGVKKPGVMCAQMIVPGYRVVFEANGQQYEYHTDETGASILPVTAVTPDPGGKILVWEQTENGACSRVEIEGTVVLYGPCEGALQESKLSAIREEELSYLSSAYAPFNTETKAGKIEFNGLGQTKATDAEKRSVAEWARLVNMEAQAGRSSAAWGLAFSWHRQGGIAGFCDDMAVYLTGWAAPESCKGSQDSAQPANEYRLSAGELAEMYAYIDPFANFYFEQTDAATADSMLVKLSFEGQGTQQATAAQQEEIAGFAGLIYANAMNQ